MQRLIVSTFPNAKALPLWVAAEEGLFSRFGLSVEIDETESSKRQREKLVSGAIHLAQAAVDNGLALIKSGYDVIIVMGGESGMNDFIVQDDIADFAGMRGRTLVVDSPDTAYALQARTLLSRAGLTAGKDYMIESVGNASLRLKAMQKDRRFGGAVMNPPFSSEAQLQGMRSLGRMIELLGPYQAGGAFLLRQWATANASTLEAYIKAYVSALRWLRVPANQLRAVDILRAHLGLNQDVAEMAFRELIDPSSGFTTDARIDMQGVTNMLATREGTEGTGSTPLVASSFIDLSYYERAVAKV